VCDLSNGAIFPVTSSDPSPKFQVHGVG